MIYVIETGQSDFHWMTFNIMGKLRPSPTNYMCFKYFSNEVSRRTLTCNISVGEFVYNDKGQQLFCKVCIETGNSFTPIKP